VSLFLFFKLLCLKSILVGDPGGSYCGLANSVGENDVSYKITVDNGNMHWFKSEGCAWEEGGFPRDTQCVNKNSMAQELGEKITWETEPPKGEFTRLFTFALLPQKGARVHTRNKIDGEGLGGPKCDELYVKFVRFHSSFLIICFQV